MYLSKAKVSYMLIIESTQDHCPRKHPLLADQLLSAEAALVLFLVSTDERLLVLQAARQKQSSSHAPGAELAAAHTRPSAPARPRPAAPGAPRCPSPANEALSPRCWSSREIRHREQILGKAVPPQTCKFSHNNQRHF